MKVAARVLLILFIFISLTAKSQTKDSTEMGPGYANEVYYGMTLGTAGIGVPVKNWDLAFRTGLMTDGILINSSNGVKLYMVQNTDISGWATLDTTNYSGWPEYYNSDTSWEKGAFNFSEPGNIYSSWGVYNQTTHILTGDSLYLLKLTTGSVTEFKKLWLIKKDNGEYHFRYANLDNSDDSTVILHAGSFPNRNFGYYSIRNKTAIDREPLNTRWDIVFTRYWAKQNDPQVPYYQVTGVLSNIGVKLAESAGLDPNTVSDYDVMNNYRSDNISVIGYDWKTPPAGPPPAKWALDTMRCYFIKSALGNIHKIIFIRFDGASNGKTVFYKYDYATTVNEDPTNPVESMTVFPNPASGTVNLVLSANISGDATISIQDISGRVQRTQMMKMYSLGLMQEAVDIQGIAPGMYIVSVVANGYATQQKLMIR